MTEGRLVKIKLHTFEDQVAGHKPMFKLNAYTLAKPLAEQERAFYKSLPPVLQEFTAQYKGSIDIEFEESDDGLITFYGTLPIEKFNTLNLGTPTSSTELDGVSTLNYLDDSACVKVKRSGGAYMNEDNLDAYDLPQQKLETNRRLHRGLARLMGGIPNQKIKFIMMENLVSGYNHPCVLDLKMGTRTHGEDDSESKKARKMATAARSTSKSLGVRMHGMQKYNILTKKVETLDKFQGVEFSEQEFERALEEFLFDGERFRHDLIEPILFKLRRFSSVLSTQHTFRIYASSLLLIYDGDYTTGKHNIRCIDFARTIHKSAVTHNSPDSGCLFGVRNLIKIFESVLERAGEMDMSQRKLNDNGEDDMQ